MSRKARIRAAAAAAVALALGLLFATGAIPGASALFQAETQNPTSTVAGGWVVAPTSMSAKPLGYGATFTWAAGTNSSGTALTSQQLYGVDRTATSNCTGAVYATIGSALTGTAASTSDAESSAKNGHYFCYQLRSFYNGWYVDTPYSPNPVQVGLIATAVTSDNNGGHSGSIEKNDHIFITFNQSINNVAGNIPIEVCTTLHLIRIGSNSCTAGTPTIGQVSVTSITGTNNLAYGTSTGTLLSVNGGTNNQLRILIAGSNTRDVVNGNGTFVPSGTAVTSATGSANVCTSASPPCQPTTAFGF